MVKALVWVVSSGKGATVLCRQALTADEVATSVVGHVFHQCVLHFLLSTVLCSRAVCGAGLCPAITLTIVSSACVCLRPRNLDRAVPCDVPDAGPSAPPRGRHAPAEGSAAFFRAIFILQHLVLLTLPARTNARSSLDKQGLPSAPDRTRGVVEH